MKIIIPMAGMGKRMRPHTLNTPKPLLKLAGKSIVERIIQDFIRASGKEIEEIHFIIGRFGKEVEIKLNTIAEKEGIACRIHYQDNPLGTGHAIYCAGEGLKGEICIVFADTLYKGDIKISDEEAIIWTKRVQDPEHYGVVLTDKEGLIEEFIEKPQNQISDQAIVGMYYFREGEKLNDYLRMLIQEENSVNSEYQITDALESMLKDGIVFRNKQLADWLDFGNKKVFLESMKVLLGNDEYREIPYFEGTEIIPPVYIGENVKIFNSVIGPNVIMEDNAEINSSEIRNSKIGSDSQIKESNISDSLIGNYCKIYSQKGVFNIGDYNELEG